MKKRIRSFILLFVVLLSVSLCVNVNAATNAKTLRELRTELNALKKQQSTNKQKQNQTKQEIKNAQNSVANKRDEIATNQQRVIDATNESIALEAEIATGKEELEKVITSYQLAMGDNVYLEYIFEATSYEDLVYRYAVMEQIMNYQEDKITEWNNKIEYNTQLKIDLEQKEVELNNQIDSLAKELENLDEELESYSEGERKIEDDIADVQELIKYYERIGCEEDEDLNKCAEVKGDTGFLKPLTKGNITSLFGYRTHPVTGKKNTFHKGIDIGGNKEGTNIYSVANGMVAKIVKKPTNGKKVCGGQQVYIYHTVNGKLYTTAYLHLLTINVTVGQQVTSNTVIGTVGGGAKTSSWESCSTGPHLHFGMATGWYGRTYYKYSEWEANLLDPQKVMGLPKKGVSWYTR